MGRLAGICLALALACLAVPAAPKKITDLKAAKAAFQKVQDIMVEVKPKADREIKKIKGIRMFRIGKKMKMCTPWNPLTPRRLRAASATTWIRRTSPTSFRSAMTRP